MTEQQTKTQWFVINHDDAPWRGIPGHAYVDLAAVAGEGAFTQYGISIDVLEPGRTNAPYHREDTDDESFLVLDGTIDAVVDEEQFVLGAGDLVHCPAGTAHVFVASGDEPAAIMMLGSREPVENPAWGAYVASERAAALGVGASVEETTTDAGVAYAGQPSYERVERPRTWRLGHATTPRPAELRQGDGGWFVVGVDASNWLDNGRTARCIFDQYGPFARYGLNIQVMRPGEPNCRYHREFSFDETMLVLEGDAILVVEGEDRPVRAGDFVHLPAGVAHVVVGAGDRPCAILMVGTRDAAIGSTDAWGEYVPDPVACRHGAAVAEQTHDPKVAYAERPPFKATRAPIWRLRR